MGLCGALVVVLAREIVCVVDLVMVIGMVLTVVIASVMIAVAS